MIRLITRRCTLYTEMFHENAVLNCTWGPREFMKFSPIEHPVVVQLGGNSPENLKKCATICEELGYDEINLNVGCPSERVQEGAFGACLMKEPDLVARIVKEMSNAVQIPVTVKCRLGVDEFDDYDFVKSFITKVATEGGTKHFILHARKAFLKGLDPHQNRTVPPLKYDWVLKLKKEFPDLQVTINGGFKTFDSIKGILTPENGLRGCMVGRAFFENPWLFSDADRTFYGEPNPGYTRREILDLWSDFGTMMMQERPYLSLPMLTKPIVNLFCGEKFNARYRQFLSDPNNFKKCDNNFETFIDTCVELYDELAPGVLDKKPPALEKEPTKEVENAI
eukprot:TRINITY_DN3542_c0_g1_i2.p1 TRINITY_DN3542_c0_g1~~TRINITY_DN3542_c0_g1_i2.p1  ORF type:complete len:337 (-),score=59.45 TRINITY_DN3542_c0_g1_i2:75-1085(-)